MTDATQNELSEMWLESLQDNGCRVTAPRRAIVRIMANSWRALDAIELFDMGRKSYPRLGLVTVYRTLEKLEQLGMVQRVHHPDGCNMYLRAPQGHEHLLLCKSCGQMEYFSGDDLSGLIADTSRQSGFIIHEHWLQLFGLCVRCKTAPASG